MAVPLPSTELVDRVPPGPDEVQFTARGIAAAVRPDGGLTPLQRSLIGAVLHSMTGHAVDVESAEAEPVGAHEFALGLARRDAVHRSRILQGMLLNEMILVPIPPEVQDRVEAFAAELGVDETLLRTTRLLARGHLALAAFDFERSGYTSGWSPDAARRLGLSELSDAWDVAPANPELAARWVALGELPDDTLGRAVHRFYEARGFALPGTPGSAPPLLAQHDWVHVVADYGSTVDNELEVFAFIARANDHPSGFSLLAMVVNLFETGYLSTGARFFESDRGHLSREGMAVRVADAMRRGALCNGSNDFLATDWFAFADWPVAEVRAHFGVTAKSPAASAAGSVGPFEPGGISPFQYRQGEEKARLAGRAHDAFGATPLE